MSVAERDPGHLLHSIYVQRLEAVCLIDAMFLFNTSLHFNENVTFVGGNLIVFKTSKPLRNNFRMKKKKKEETRLLKI